MQQKKGCKSPGPPPQVACPTPGRRCASCGHQGSHSPWVGRCRAHEHFDFDARVSKATAGRHIKHPASKQSELGFQTTTWEAPMVETCPCFTAIKYCRERSAWVASEFKRKSYKIFAFRVCNATPPIPPPVTRRRSQVGIDHQATPFLSNVPQLRRSLQETFQSLGCFPRPGIFGRMLTGAAEP